ncbi:MFS transporter [Pelagicoccus sp. SDUM812002]|uniref:MFS transporter n=1 Tax=Pelagicoccus sp. SDUM812002 TaxID=3041266 RepID=UPI00280EB7CB|nr:MFS transporter [Pelagicoccus sp. SDUM812002]MDQ8187513.1 MFS transporter [Pelagicoccus sp. SDUM812002]
MPVDSHTVKRTFRWDCVRGGLSGVVETGYGGFALIVAIGVFQAPDTVKGIIAAAGPLGLLLNPISLSIFSRTNCTASQLSAWIAYLAGGALLMASFAESLLGFLVPACFAFALSAQSMPLLVQIWTYNYPSNKRGAYLSISMMANVAAAFAFSVAGGWILDANINSYRWVFVGISLAYLLSGVAVSRIPSNPVQKGVAQNPLRNLGYAVEDKKFGVLLVSWMFLGFGNLMVLPIRVEYLLQPEYGILASKLTVMMVTIGIPAAFRFLTSRIWGYLFDNLDFMLLRIVLNAMIMLSIVLFLTTANMWIIYSSAAVLGTAMAGANISWSLWVTKFAKPERASSYMSVHAFTTGFRGILAPFLGFYLISGLGATKTAIVGASLVLVSIVMVSAMYVTLRRTGRPVQA